jgi:hypothetical protein
MFGIASLLVIVLLSLLITRIATVALVATMVLMLWKAGLAAVIASLMIGFTRSGGLHAWRRVAELVGGLALLLVLARSRWVDRRLTELISRLIRRYTDLDTRDYAALLDVGGDSTVLELAVPTAATTARRAATRASARPTRWSSTAAAMRSASSTRALRSAGRRRARPRGRGAGTARAHRRCTRRRRRARSSPNGVSRRSGAGAEPTQPWVTRLTGSEDGRESPGRVVSCTRSG